MPFASLKLFVLINWGKLMAFAPRHKIQYLIISLTSSSLQLLPTPLKCAVQHPDRLKQSWALRSFRSHLELLMQCRPFSRELTFKGQDWAQHGERRPSGALTSDMIHYFLSGCIYKRCYFNFSPPKPQNPRIIPHRPSFTALEKHDLTLPQPKVTWSAGGLRLRLHPSSSLSRGRGDTLLRRPFLPLPKSCCPLPAPRVLWPVLWDWRGEKRETNWLRMVLKLDERQDHMRAC